MDEGSAWFEARYASASGADEIPWADLQPNPQLMAWLDEHEIQGAGRRALTVGAGLGDDAEALAQRGFAVTAFDVAPTAVRWAQTRFPDSVVEYRVADVLAPPAEWRGAFALILESYTLQSLSPELLPAAADAIGSMLAPGGTLLVIAIGRDPGPRGPSRPWPLTAAELTGLFASLELERLEDFLDEEQPPKRRLRAEFRQRDRS